MAHVAGVDVAPVQGDGRPLTDLDRLEEYSANHAETFDQLGEWDADRFEAAWEAFTLRQQLDHIERYRHDMTMALYGNGMIGGDDLTRELNSIEAHAETLRRQVLGADPITEGQFSDVAPMPRDDPRDDAGGS